MDRFQALTAFARVVETGSFARAAERLDVSVSAVSRQVADLEAHLGARLLNRTTRRLSLTESGQVFYERCVQLLADLNAFVHERNASKLPGEPQDEPFSENDLTKLAYWMATGSGKTLILHLNYYQFLHYNKELLDNILW